ncbi:uncharacterized protein E0L32_006803 [Thyridium curvatum]|uniref:Phospholipase C n=1 Tax=Thyridium curvatum TaxID=1093900 RepID=A0A507B5T4_9PEZI|nr:uncharacterized protein E0L32_006803 [Thyridium curvatum]TPX12391.1 hypothetical protein E0L32_006803 [Thyridium curvatum]
MQDTVPRAVSLNIASERTDGAGNVVSHPPGGTAMYVRSMAAADLVHSAPTARQPDRLLPKHPDLAAIMAVLSKLASVASVVPVLIGLVHAGSLADIDHVVLFMQENRAFDHYFGTMAGVRGFSDPNVQVNGNRTVWQQTVDDTKYLKPWYLNYLGGDWLNATQCMNAGSNGWNANQLAMNHGANDMWAIKNTPWSWGHFRRSDIPVHFDIAEGWTIGDMYQESVIASTNPNRVTWVSGSINAPGSPQNKSEGGYPYIDNNETPGCDKDGINCYPLKWKTAGDIYSAQNVTWQVYQDADNFDDNPFAWFGQFQTAPQGSDMHSRGMQGLTLNTFYEQAANGTLPAVSYIVGPAQLSEHPQYSPRDGVWLQKKIVEAVMSSPAYARTALIISYDETGGFGDHVTPYHAPDGTPGEWIQDPWAGLGRVPTGPGFRVPFFIVSPWTRGGKVFTEHADHNSQLLFVEKWQAAKGRDVRTDEMPAWRREHMSDLVAAFDFDNPDLSLPQISYAIPPHQTNGQLDGAAYCTSKYPVQRPPVPYSGQPGAVEDVPALSEEGFKEMRGMLTEGRYLVLESGAAALANPRNDSARAVTSAATQKHDDKAQRWVAHADVIGGDMFRFSSALDGRWLAPNGKMISDKSKAGSFQVAYAPSKGYSLKSKCGVWLSAGQDGKIAWAHEAAYWKAYSVTYKN